ncbi:MAG TPA: SIMPL domain-containing protein [Pilimelia sp.]|nr:SIMPL domain-containing protein [Pilimelia sp.]
MVDVPTVAVRGEAVLEVAPEIARFSVTVSARDKDRQATLTRLTQRVDAIRAVLDEYGAAIERRETGIVQVRPELKRSGERISAYVASLTTTVTVTDFTVLGDLMLRLADEEQTSVFGPWWGLRPDSKAHRQARRAAVDDAMTRAQEYAEAIGRKVGRLLELSDSGMSGAPTPRMAYAADMRTMSAGTPELDLEPQQQTVHGSVEMKFVLVESAGFGDG